MSHATTGSARVIDVAAGVENTDRRAPVRDGRHQALAVLIGKWINEGHATGTAEIPPVLILTSDVYEWAPGGFFVVHSAFGKIGETAVTTSRSSALTARHTAPRSKTASATSTLTTGDRGRRDQVDRGPDAVHRNDDG